MCHPANPCGGIVETYPTWPNLATMMFDLARKWPDKSLFRAWRDNAWHATSWDEFARPDAPVLDFVFTVCDQAAGEICPLWPGNPITAHWGVPDPAAVEGSEEHRRQAFRDACRQLEARIKLFTALPIDKLDRLALKRRSDQIGRSIEHEKT